jgi:hypothetical protein
MVGSWLSVCLSLHAASFATSVVEICFTMLVLLRRPTDLVATILHWFGKCVCPHPLASCWFLLARLSPTELVLQNLLARLVASLSIANE